MNKKTFAILLIVSLGLFFNLKYLKDFPNYKHAWAQSDRYALAQGFVNNNLNLFKPETFVYNHQFPHNWRVCAEQTITAVDFPIHDYIVAVFMKILGSKSPWIFRVYTLIYSFLGLFFLFKLSNLLSNDFYKSLFITAFAATSPVFMFYQNGFLPSIPSLANAFIGLYFYTKYLNQNQHKYFVFCLLFLTLSTLSRATFAIPLIAILGYEFLRFLQNKSKIKKKLLPTSISIAAILFYFFYNDFLRKKYGSVFLNYLLPVTSIEELFNIIKITFDNWFYEYFLKIHYFLLAGLLLAAVMSVLLKRVRVKEIHKNILFLSGIMLLGCILFFLFMIRQFPNHDYYFLDTFFLPIILFLIVIVSLIPVYLKKRNVVFLFALLFVSMAAFAYKAQKRNHTEVYWEVSKSTLRNFKNAEKIIDSLGIDKKAKMLVIDTYSPNTPFFMMNRKGYILMSPKKEDIIRAMEWDFDYIVTQNELFIPKIYAIYPEIIFRTKKIWDNGKFMISKLENNSQHKTVSAYLGLDKKTSLRHEIINYDDHLANGNWKNIVSTPTLAFSGKYAGILKEDMIYGLTYQTKKISEIEEKECVLFIESYFFNYSEGDVNLVVSVNERGNNIYYKVVNLRSFFIKKQAWQKASLILNLPKVRSDDYEFSIFLWNVNKEKLLVDDFEFTIY